MSNYLKTLLLPATLIVLGVTVATPASAGMIANQSYNFTGACSDCFSGKGNATATLTLTGNYTLGTAITGSNFVNFTYNGTNLLAGFSINPGDGGFGVSGNLMNIPGFNNLSVSKSGSQFMSFSSGSWCAGSACTNDFGTLRSGTYSAASTGAPEPATMGLLGLGLVAMTVAGRLRRSKK